MKKIEGNLRIEIGDTRDFSQLEEVTGYVDVQENAKFTAPVLATLSSLA